MVDDEKLIDAFHRADQRGQTAILAYALSMSEDWPLNVTSPVSLPAGELHNLEAPSVVSPPKKVK